MKRVIWTVLTLAVATLALPAMDLDAQANPVRVEEIRLDPDAHVNEIRTVSGVVDRLVSRGGSATTSYYLEDDFGHQIMVIPFAAPPARGERVAVTGVVTLDPSGDPVLTLFDPTAAAPPPEAADGPSIGPAPATPRPGPPSAPPVWWRRPLVLGGIGLGLVLLFAFAYNRGRSGAPPPLVTAPLAGRHDVDFATSALWPESDQQFDGRTLRFTRPDPTVQLLPGRLEVIGGGDAGEVIHFVAVHGETVEMMFGRSPGSGPGNVELKQKTVSRTHAIVRHRHGEWLLENLSMTNPTVLNDEILGVKERLLTDGDRIEMGEVVFRFRVS